MKRILLFVLSLFALAAHAETVAIRNVRLFDGTRVVPRATVVFDGAKIVAAGADVAVPDGARVVDGTGKTLLPGLIDAHTHTFGPALERALRFGVTTELDMFTAVAELRRLKDEQARGNVATRADIVSAGTLVTVKGGHGTQYFPIPVFAPGDDARAYIDARIAEGSDFIKLVYEDGSAFGLQFASLTKSDLRALIAAAHARGKLAVVHVSTLAGARDAIESGADGLVHLFGNQAPDAGFGALAAKKKVFVIPTLTVVESSTGVASGAVLLDDARLKAFIDADETRGLRGSFPKREKSTQDLAHAFATVRQLKAAGVPILAGTDAPNPGTAHGVSMHRELELLVQAGLTPVEALTAATSAAANAFGLKDRGRIAAGMRADLLLVDGDPTRDILATRAISAIWKGGVALERVPESAKKTTAAAPANLVPVIANFESGEAKSAFGAGWMISTDAMMGGKSTATMDVVDGGAKSTAKSLRVQAVVAAGAPFPWAGPMLFFGDAQFKPADLSSKRGLVFHARGDVDIHLMLFAASLGRIPATKTVRAGAEWTEIAVSWSDFGVDGKDVQAVLFSAAPKPGASELWIDEVGLQ